MECWRLEGAGDTGPYALSSDPHPSTRPSRQQAGGSMFIINLSLEKSSILDTNPNNLLPGLITL